MKRGHLVFILVVSALISLFLINKRADARHKVGLRAIEELSEESGKAVVSIEEVGDAFFSEYSVVVFRGGEEVIGGQRTYHLERCEFVLDNPPKPIRPCHNVLLLHLAPK